MRRRGCAGGRDGRHRDGAARRARAGGDPGGTTEPWHPLGGRSRATGVACSRSAARRLRHRRHSGDALHQRRARRRQDHRALRDRTRAGDRLPRPARPPGGRPPDRRRPRGRRAEEREADHRHGASGGGRARPRGRRRTPTACRGRTRGHHPTGPGHDDVADVADAGQGRRRGVGGPVARCRPEARSRRRAVARPDHGRHAQGSRARRRRTCVERASDDQRDRPRLGAAG